ncbi:MAG: methionyl-tRNA formyltransferase, partial [Flavobacteriaceae bacterium]|nr:methionyl-tRNA formyltransferase [Flavobacteriaceae bacterium]
GTLHDKLMEVGTTVVLETVAQIEAGTTNPTVQQSTSELKEAPKLNAENTRIDWAKGVKEIVNFIRGLSPFPVAWSLMVNGEEELNVKFYDAYGETIEHDDEIGRIITTKKEIKVAVNDGYLYIKELKLPGKRKMHSRDLLNGYRFEKDAQFL